MKKIKQVELKKLFGYGKNNYIVNFLENEPLTFVYGFNGIGKTTLFRLIDAAIKRKMTVLDSITFESVKLTFDTDESLTVKKLFMKPFDEITMGELPKEGDKYYFPIVYEWQTPGKEVIIGKHFFHKERSEEINALLKDDFETYSKLPYSRKTDKGLQKIPLSMFYKNPIVVESIDRSEIENSILYIGVNILYANKDYNRLAATDDARYDYKVSIFENYKSNDIIPLEINWAKEQLQKREVDIETIAEISWAEFESGLFSSDKYDNEPHFWYLELDDKIQYMQKKLYGYFEEFKKLKNLEIEERVFDEIIFDNVTNPIDLTLDILKNPNLKYELILNYVQKQKKRILLFEHVINSKACLTDKNILINKTTGEIEIKLDFEEGGYISPERLSSGEKNMLLLYFHLIFLVPDKHNENAVQIELIDEPEVSMHPDWLITFIETLKFINKKLERGDNIQFIVATHSPAITYANSQLMVEMRRC